MRPLSQDTELEVTTDDNLVTRCRLGTLHPDQQRAVVNILEGLADGEMRRDPVLENMYIKVAIDGEIIYENRGESHIPEQIIALASILRGEKRGAHKVAPQRTAEVA